MTTYEEAEHKPYWDYIMGDLFALDDIELEAPISHKEFLCQYQPGTKKDILLLDYLVLLDGRTVDAIIQPSKNKDLAEFLGFYLDDDNIYIRSHQIIGAPFQVAKNIKLNNLNSRDMWELEPLPNCRSIKEGLLYLYDLKFNLQASKKIVRSDFERARRINNIQSTAPSIKSKPNTHQHTAKKSFINDDEIIDISQHSKEALLSLLESNPLAIAKIMPYTELERILGISYAPIQNVCREELEMACRLHNWLVEAHSIIEKQYVTRTDYMYLAEFTNCYKKLEAVYQLNEQGKSQFIEQVYLLEYENEICRQSDDFNESYKTIQSELKKRYAQAV